MFDVEIFVVHCWDYRRWVVKHSERTAEEELEYTSKKINQNFSNYSAWHYRSSLLPRVHGVQAPVLEAVGASMGGIEQRVLGEELDMVQSACFTEPDDQSAWLYQQWLLSKVLRTVHVNGCFVSEGKYGLCVVCVFSEKVYKPNFKVGGGFVKLLSDNAIAVKEECSGWDWFPGFAEQCGGSHDDVSSVTSMLWVYQSNIEPSNIEGKDLTVEINFREESIVGVDGRSLAGPEMFHFKCQRREGKIIGGKLLFRRSVACDETSDLLESLLDSCQQLVELEPNSRWAIFNSLHLMQLKDFDAHYKRVDYEYPADIPSCVEALEKVDSKRRGFYSDLKSKLALDFILGKAMREVDFDALSQELSLSSMKLTAVYFGERMSFCRKIDLSCNSLSVLSGVEFNVNLKSVEELILDENSFSSLVDLDLGYFTNLRSLSIRNNLITNICGVSSTSIRACASSLLAIDLSGNPVSENNTDLQIVLKEIFPKIVKVNGAFV